MPSDNVLGVFCFTKNLLVMKRNLLLGTASGKLGDMVLYRAGGEQRARAYVKTVTNRQTDAQLTSRVLLTTVSRAYSAMRWLVNHSFQGETYGAKNQQKFSSLNLELLRTYYEDDVDGIGFASKDIHALLVNPYQMSDGSLTSIGGVFKSVTIGNLTTRAHFALPLPIEGVTPASLQNVRYGQIREAFNLTKDSYITIYIPTQGNQNPSMFDEPYTREELDQMRGVSTKYVRTRIKLDKEDFTDFFELLGDPGDNDPHFYTFNADATVDGFWPSFLADTAGGSHVKFLWVADMDTQRSYLVNNPESIFESSHSGREMAGGVAIKSQRGSNGWNYSREYLLCDVYGAEWAGTYNMAKARQSYRKQHDSSLYLNGGTYDSSVNVSTRSRELTPDTPDVVEPTKKAAKKKPAQDTNE